MDQESCVHVINKVRKFTVDTKRITKIAVEICERLGVHHYEVCVQFISPKVMRDLNKTFRQKDKSTDVLSFPQYNWKKSLKANTGKLSLAKRKIMNPMPLGDVVICLEDALANAAESRHGFDQEVCFLLVHGILHLVGHDHMKPGEKRRMLVEQKKLMTCLRGPKKTPLWQGCVSTLKKGR